MSQLSGPEQGELVSLLTQHTDSIDSLSNAMHHSGLGRAADYSIGASKPVVISAIVYALSNQYKVIQLVEAVLNDKFGLKGNCPPIEAWLGRMREVLQDRQLEISKGKHAITSMRPWRDVPITDAVMLFPTGPNVRETVPRSLLLKVSELISPRDARALVNEANLVRLTKDPGNDRQKIVPQGRLPEPATGMEYFIGCVFDEARFRGPRTVAAVLLVLGNECTSEIQDLCDEYLQTLIHYQ